VTYDPPLKETNGMPKRKSTTEGAEGTATARQTILSFFQHLLLVLLQYLPVVITASAHGEKPHRWLPSGHNKSTLPHGLKLLVGLWIVVLESMKVPFLIADEPEKKKARTSKETKKSKSKAIQEPLSEKPDQDWMAKLPEDVRQRIQESSANQQEFDWKKYGKPVDEPIEPFNASEHVVRKSLRNQKSKKEVDFNKDTSFSKKIELYPKGTSITLSFGGGFGIGWRNNVLSEQFGMGGGGGGGGGVDFEFPFTLPIIHKRHFGFGGGFGFGFGLGWEDIEASFGMGGGGGCGMGLSALETKEADLGTFGGGGGGGGGFSGKVHRGKTLDVSYSGGMGYGGGAGYQGSFSTPKLDEKQHDFQYPGGGYGANLSESIRKEDWPLTL
jgi:hypothetical protein